MRERATVLRYTYIVGLVCKLYHRLLVSRDLLVRGELSYLAPLGSEKVSAPYFKQCFFRGGAGGITPQTVKHHASQSQDRNNKYFILYIEFVAADLLFRLGGNATRVKRRLLFDRVGVFMADIICTLLSLLLCL